MTDNPLVTGMKPKRRQPAERTVGRTKEALQVKFITRPVNHRLNAVYLKLLQEGWKVETEGYVCGADGVVRWAARLYRFEKVKG